MSHNLSCCETRFRCAVDIHCTAALTSLSDSVSYITFLFSEWRIQALISQRIGSDGVISIHKNLSLGVDNQKQILSIEAVAIIYTYFRLTKDR